MRERKSPTLAGMGRQKKVINVQGDGIPTAPVRQEICHTCHYFRAVRSGQKLRSFCAFTGELVRPGTPACEFWPGRHFVDAVLDDVEPAAGVFGLTRAGAAGMVETPNQTRRHKCLLAAPRLGKTLSANSAAVGAPAISVGQLSHIGRVQRPQVREAAAASFEPGSVVALPFLRPTANNRRILP